MKQNKLVPLIPNFNNRSMVRRQDCLPAYKIFYGEFFKFPKKFNKKFLGNHFKHVVQNDLCNIDIDNNKQFKLYEKLILSEKKNMKTFYTQVKKIVDNSLKNRIFKKKKER